MVDLYWATYETPPAAATLDIMSVEEGELLMTVNDIHRIVDVALVGDHSGEGPRCHGAAPLVPAA
jgi:hypothetical protein